jgi:DNA-binding FadR family transcriptional regulator
MPGRTLRASAVIVGDIRRKIVSGELSEGESLPPETQLMYEYGVSKPTVREARRVLESEGLITVRRGAVGGAVVRAPSTVAAARQVSIFLERRRARLSDVHSTRDLIESSVAFELARRGGSADLSGLRAQALADAGGASDLAACRAGEGFHRALVVAAGNKTLALYQSLITPFVDKHIDRFLTAVPEAGSAAHPASPRISHPTLLRLIESGDTSLARDFWHEHLAWLEEQLAGVRFSMVTDLSGS